MQIIMLPNSSIWYLSLVENSMLSGSIRMEGMQDFASKMRSFACKQQWKHGQTRKPTQIIQISGYFYISLVFLALCKGRTTFCIVHKPHPPVKLACPIFNYQNYPHIKTLCTANSDNKIHNLQITYTIKLSASNCIIHFGYINVRKIPKIQNFPGK